MRSLGALVTQFCHQCSGDEGLSPWFSSGSYAKQTTWKLKQHEEEHTALSCDRLLLSQRAEYVVQIEAGKNKFFQSRQKLLSHSSQIWGMPLRQGKQAYKIAY